jgi:dephospho-CoA kinase
MSFVVGMTGGIGSGKTTVANLFAELGAAVIDTDAIAHELTGPRGAAMPDIARAFGEGVFQANGSLDRVAMRQLCFSDPTARKRLESILHPLIRSESIARCRRADYAPYVMLVVPLLIESGAYREHIDRILVIDCAESVQVARVMVRSRLSADEVLAIMATQASREERRAAADDVLTNDDGLDELQPQVLRLHHRYVEFARKAPVREDT